MAHEEIAWSKSRQTVFEDCPRRYYYHYYGHVGGDRPDAPERTREIARLRHLRSRHMWAGEVVHATLEQVLRDRRGGQDPPPLAAILARVRSEMRDAFRASREGRFRNESPPTSLALLEHDYGRRVPDADWRALADQVDRCIERFFQTDTWSKLDVLDPRYDWLELEDLRGFHLAGKTRVRVKLDFAHRDGSEVVIVDWKTGRSRSHARLQFGGYVLYVAGAWGTPPERIRGLEVNLTTDRVREHRFTTEDLEAVEQRIHDGAAAMRKQLRDPEQNLAVEADFVTRPSPWRCGMCPYFRVCPDSGSGFRYGPAPRSRPSGSPPLRAGSARPGRHPSGSV